MSAPPLSKQEISALRKLEDQQNGLAIRPARRAIVSSDVRRGLGDVVMLVASDLDADLASEHPVFHGKRLHDLRAALKWLNALANP